LISFYFQLIYLDPDFTEVFEAYLNAFFLSFLAVLRSSRSFSFSVIDGLRNQKKKCCQTPAHTHLATRPHAQKKLLSATRPHPLSAARPQPPGKKINLHLIISSYTHNYTQKKTVTNPKPPPPNHPPNPALNVEDYG
jgi:hypothetical protein